MKFLSAGEFAKAIGVCKNTLANYEKKSCLFLKGIQDVL